jgi:acyl-CoA synthetase (NDP forming)
MAVNTKSIDRIFAAAERDGRDFLLEPEVYAVLRAAGIAVLRHVFVPRGRKVTRDDIAKLGPAGVVVLKIVSSRIQHKSDVGGVAFVAARPAAVNTAVAAMEQTVVARSAEPSRDVECSLSGVLLMEKVAFDNVGFGSEILLGARTTREFGPVLTVGAGGLDVEYMNEHLRDGRAAALFSAELMRDDFLPAGLEPLAFFGKVAAEFRGRKALVAPAAFARTVSAFRELVRAYSPFGDASPFVIEEIEVNPLVVRTGKLVPLDGLCRFSRRKTALDSRPAEGVGRLLRPETIGIIGVSEKMNVGRIILRNVLKHGFPPDRVFVVKPGLPEIDGCRCVPTVADLPVTVDLFVLTLAAEQCPDVMRELAAHEKARSVIAIAGGMGEKTGTTSIEEDIRAILAAGRAAGRTTPVVNGGNCLGIYSPPGRYDTTFIPDYKLKRPEGASSGLVFLSQSGAFMISRMSKLPRVQPLYAVSMGNQLDLTVSDYLDVLKDDPEARFFAVYMEGFRPGDGHLFARAVAAAVARGKIVLVYKSGRSPEGRAATSSHTASVAGEYAVCRAILEQAGAIVAEDIFEFESFLKALVRLDGRPVAGDRVGLISNAGFECVIMADSLRDGYRLRPAAFSEATRERILAALRPLGIDRLQDVHNPLDVTPVADDAAFIGCARAVLEDENVDAAVVSPVPMTPAMQTLPPSLAYKENMLATGGFVPLMRELFHSVNKPVVVNIDAGELYTPLAESLEEAGIPVFRRSDEALRFLRKFVGTRRKENR